MSKASPPTPVQHEALLKDVFRLRTQVFVEEQSVDAELEFDEFEESSRHWASLVEDKVVACARYRRTARGYKIERMAVDIAFRKQGLGRELLQRILTELRPLASEQGCPIYLHAQVQALPFYTNQGFVTEGDEFEEAGIAHYRCRYQEPLRNA